MDGSDRVEQFFVIRVWRESGAQADGWRGYVEHVATQRRLYFSALADLTDFLRLTLDRCEKPTA
ncbi:MAG: hypothetical protein ABI186_03660 [Candidatus Elarobacter sp.]